MSNNVTVTVNDASETKIIGDNPEVKASPDKKTAAAAAVKESE